MIEIFRASSCRPTPRSLHSLHWITTALGALAIAALAISSAPAVAQQSALKMGLVLEPPTLDPTAGAAAAIDEIVYANVFEGLTRYAEDGTIRPGLAASWTISEDGLTYTFALQEGVSFHDGARFEAADVVFSFQRAVEEGSTNAQQGLFEPIESVVAKGDTTVVITLKRPTGAFLQNLGWGDMVIVDPASAETNGTDPVGTGPFRFVEWRKGSSVDLARFDDYWGEPAALETVTFQFIPEPTAAFAAMMAGDLDAFANFPAPENIPLFEADARFSVVVGSTEGETILAMNNASEPLSNPLVRRAISHAINRQDIIDGAMFGLGTPIGTHFAPHNPAYVDLLDSYPYDPEQARAMLAEAGYPDGFSASLMLPPPSYARRGGEIVAAQLREIGIDVQITNVEWAQWLSDVFKETSYDFTIVSHTEPMDIGIYARDDYYFNYDSPEFKALIAQLNETADPAARTELLQAAQRKITEDAVNVYLFQLAKAGVWNEKLEGLWSNSPVQANDVTGVRWTD